MSVFASATSRLRRLLSRRRPPSRTATSAGLAIAATVAVIAALVPALAPAASAQSTSSLPSCPFWDPSITPPSRPVTTWIPPDQTASAIDFASRMPAPSGVGGSLANGQVTITFAPVPGAAAYRVWRNGIALAWVDNEGQSSFTVTDTTPCQGAFYTLAALSNNSADDASMGQLSAPYQLNSSGVVVPWQTPVNSTISMLVTSYNDGGETASGLDTELGICAVDPRVIPWGTYFTVPGYGTCFAADIGEWIQNDTVDVWLPGSQANGWGVQDRTITIIANPYAGGPTGGPTTSTSPTSSPSHSASPSASPSGSPTPPPTGGNLVANSGFETGSLSPWTCDAGTAAVVSSPVHSGSHALAATPTSSDDAQCTQTVAVSPNTTYALSAWVEGPYAYIGATVPGGTGASTWTPGATSWTQLSTSFTTGASTTSVTVYAHGWYGQAAIDVDDVSLTG